MSCSSLKIQSTIKDNPPVNSMAVCPAIQKDGNYKTFGDTVVKLIEVIGLYNECAIRHEALINYVKEK